MSNNPMLNIAKDSDRIPVAILKRFEGMPLGFVCDSNGRKVALGGGVRPFCNYTAFVSTAFTVSCAAGDNLDLHAAMKYVRPGDVLVVNGEEFGECAVKEDPIMGMAENSGTRALITSTHIRDHDGREVLDIAFFAKG